MNKNLLVFDIAGDKYGVDILDVNSISDVTSIKKIYEAPHYFEGLMNLRGKAIPIINLAKKFSFSSNGEFTKAIISDVFGDDIGFMISGQTQVIAIDETDIEDLPMTVKSDDNKYISGVAKHDNALILLLDFKYILSNVERNEILDYE